MKYICVYTDLVNQGLTYKAEIDCDNIEVMDTTEIEGAGTIIGFYKSEKIVFMMHEYRIIEAYRQEAVSIQQIDKKVLNTKRANPKNLSLLQD